MVVEIEGTTVGDMQGHWTLSNLMANNLKSAIFNFAEARKNVKTSTVGDGWKSLLFNSDISIVDFTGFEV